MPLKASILLLLVSYAAGAHIRAVGDSCPLFCNHIGDQLLCGSDTVTYRNHCYFHKAQCMDPNLKLAHQGPCMTRGRGIICTTPACWPNYDPVCGSDRITYDNVCMLNNAMCDNEYLKVEHKGTCTQMFP